MNLEFTDFRYLIVVAGVFTYANNGIELDSLVADLLVKRNVPFASIGISLVRREPS